MLKLFQNLLVLEHIEIPNVKGMNPQQDIWILTKE